MDKGRQTKLFIVYDIHNNVIGYSHSVDEESALVRSTFRLGSRVFRVEANSERISNLKNKSNNG